LIDQLTGATVIASHPALENSRTQVGHPLKYANQGINFSVGGLNLWHNVF